MEVCQALGNIQKVNQGKYLGLPMVITRSKQQLFGYIKDNIQQRLKKWKNKLLSAAGKEVMLKSVAMAMPTYTMSCFKMPKKICKEINAVMANYWWGEATGRNKMHWRSWSKISMDRKDGGLGFLDLEAFNTALLGKQGLMGARQLIEQGTRRRIGNGKSTYIWEESWMPDNHQGKVTTQKPQGCNLVKVEELIIQNRWNKNLIFRNFCPKDAEMILSIPISLANREDNNYWIHSFNGIYTVRLAYSIQSKGQMEREQEDTKTIGTSWSSNSKKSWKHLWKLNIKHKVKIFLWKCLNQVLPCGKCHQFSGKEYKTSRDVSVGGGLQ
nr:uncharacterized protein LOC113739155 [Coffea arabica]